MLRNDEGTATYACGTHKRSTEMRNAGTRLSALFGAAVLLAALPAVSVALTLKTKTIDAWNTYVAATEARIACELASDHGFLALDFCDHPEEARAQLLQGEVIVTEVKTTNEEGKGIRIPGGIIHHWRGAVFLPGVEIDDFLARVKNPVEMVPNQPEVLEKRIVHKTPDELLMYIKMTRKKFVTLTYNTEHDVTFYRYSPSRASSRSEATRIAELTKEGTPEEAEKPPGQDRGFMWRLNSYWRYEEVAGGLIVEGESMLLSREIPFFLRPFIDPLIDNAAREMITHTMEETRKNHLADSQIRITSAK
jgi:hypothetical protein